MGSIPVRVTKQKQAQQSCACFCLVIFHESGPSFFACEKGMSAARPINISLKVYPQIGFSFPYGSPTKINPDCFVNQNRFGFVFFYNYSSQSKIHRREYCGYSRRCTYLLILYPSAVYKTVASFESNIFSICRRCDTNTQRILSAEKCFNR